MDGICRGCFRIDHFSSVGDVCDDDGFVVDKGFEVFSTGELRIAVVYHFIEEFVEEDEVFTYGFFGECAAVVFEYFGNS